MVCQHLRAQSTREPQRTRLVYVVGDGAIYIWAVLLSVCRVEWYKISWPIRVFVQFLSSHFTQRNWSSAATYLQLGFQAAPQEELEPAVDPRNCDVFVQIMAEKRAEFKPGTGKWFKDWYRYWSTCCWRLQITLRNWQWQLSRREQSTRTLETTLEISQSKADAGKLVLMVDKWFAWLLCGSDWSTIVPLPVSVMLKNNHYVSVTFQYIMWEPHYENVIWLKHGLSLEAHLLFPCAAAGIVIKRV